MAVQKLPERRDKRVKYKGKHMKVIILSELVIHLQSQRDSLVTA